MNPSKVYALYRVDPARKVRAVSFDAGRTEIRASGAVAWVWLGTLYAGLPVETPRATYSLTRAGLRTLRASGPDPPEEAPCMKQGNEGRQAALHPSARDIEDLLLCSRAKQGVAQNAGGLFYNRGGKRARSKVRAGAIALLSELMKREVPRVIADERAHAVSGS